MSISLDFTPPTFAVHQKYKNEISISTGANKSIGFLKPLKNN